MNKHDITVAGLTAVFDAGDIAGFGGDNGCALGGADINCGMFKNIAIRIVGIVESRGNCIFRNGPAESRRAEILKALGFFLALKLLSNFFF